MSHVLDASALLAFLKGEPGAEAVEGILSGALMSSVNWSEVIQKCLAYGVEIEGMRQEVEALGLSFRPFDEEQGELAAALWLKCKGLGLSLGDRACLALGLQSGRAVVTADRAWERADVGVEIRFVR
ncbi:type II toxin-antitoxin system VapC family toxin [Methyloterricola oryzae]|uniref:type II toxin-antitoxin system VapC family toxin n=1 Tax=Methyloterricola oryzae TaxID=1495050 RepID=UPI0005EB83A3|nr:type II toxin-antitoxin system VapC family toxin [Methyloterricola oryzae]